MSYRCIHISGADPTKEKQKKQKTTCKSVLFQSRRVHLTHNRDIEVIENFKQAK